MSTVFHIRKPLRAAGGNQFYRDRSNRYTGTFCGADATGFDAAARDKALPWSADGVDHTPCAACTAARDALVATHGRKALNVR